MHKPLVLVTNDDGIETIRRTLARLPDACRRRGVKCEHPFRRHAVHRVEVHATLAASLFPAHRARAGFGQRPPRLPGQCKMEGGQTRFRHAGAGRTRDFGHTPFARPDVTREPPGGGEPAPRSRSAIQPAPSNSNAENVISTQLYPKEPPIQPLLLLHFQSRTSGISSPCSCVYFVCSINLNSNSCLTSSAWAPSFGTRLNTSMIKPNVQHFLNVEQAI